MVRVAAIALRVAVSLLAVVVATGAALLACVTVPALPQREGTVRLPGLEAPVTVIHDAAGIAHITAASPHDLFMAQGYVHAQERLWQMEIWRRIGAGRLSELLGEAALETDRFVRTLDWRRAATRDLALVSASTRAGLDAYAEGVNAYLADHRGRLGLTFAIAARSVGGFEPEPWTPLDTASFQKLQAWNLGGNMDSEIFRMLADQRLGEATVDDLFPAYRGDAPVITPTGLPGSGGAGASGSSLLAPRVQVAGTRDRSPTTELVAWHELAAIASDVSEMAGVGERDRPVGAGGIGSNNWAVAPEKSASGHALLANDPHLGIGMPSVWFMNGLHCEPVGDDCPYDIAGVSFPGVPGVVLGHNTKVAWGATNVGPDVQDLFIETVDPDDPSRYLFRGEPLPFQVRREEILVKGGETEVLEVRETHHGPVITDVHPRLAPGPPVALRWAAIAEPDGALESFFRLATVSSFEEFREAFRGYGSPSQNFVYADVDGHIGYVLPGTIPIRAGGARGDRPVDAASGEHDWTGVIPFDELPWQLDPPSGVIVTANNAAVDDRYPHFIAEDWDRGDRAQRILDLLAEAESGGISQDEMLAIQSDTLLLRFERILGALPELSPATEDGRLVLERIRSWQGRASVDSLGCAAYMAFEVAALRAVFDDELGDLARDYVGGDASLERLPGLLATPDHAWWDNSSTAGRESAREILSAALDDAGRQLRSVLGEPEGWTWGRLHRAAFRDPTLGQSGIPPIEFLLNHGPIQADGAAGAIDNTYYNLSRLYPDPTDPEFVPRRLDGAFEVTVLPSYRLAIDLGSLDEARIIQTTGQSGHPFDHHYGDLIDDWQTGATLPLPFSPAAIERSRVATLILMP